MGKKKLEVVELELGNETTIPKTPINKETTERIEAKLEVAAKEQNAIQRIMDEKKAKDEATQICFQMLVDAGLEGVPAEQLLKIENCPNLISLIGKLRSIIKKRDNIWKIRRRTKLGKTIYFLEPS